MNELTDILQAIAKMFKHKNYSNEFMLYEEQRKTYELYSNRLKKAYKEMNDK